MTTVCHGTTFRLVSTKRLLGEDCGQDLISGFKAQNKWEPFALQPLPVQNRYKIDTPKTEKHDNMIVIKVIVTNPILFAEGGFFVG